MGDARAARAEAKAEARVATLSEAGPSGGAGAGAGAGVEKEKLGQHVKGQSWAGLGEAKAAAGRDTAAEPDMEPEGVNLALLAARREKVPPRCKPLL